jgi:hypothetical protein
LFWAGPEEKNDKCRKEITKGVRWWVKKWRIGILEPELRLVPPLFDPYQIIQPLAVVLKDEGDRQWLLAAE